MRAALLFPGQGAQRPGFLRQLPQHPAVTATLEEAGQILAEDPRRLDEAAALQSTVSVQLALLIAGVSAARALTAEGVGVDAVAGLSIGAFAAAVTCGVLTFADALRLVKLRAETMARAAPRGYGMTAVLGLTERDARALVTRIQAREALYLASVNAPTELVVSGAESALALAEEQARAQGASTRRLQVSIPSHSALMDEVSVRLRAALAGISLRRPALAYICNHNARLAGDAVQVAEDLAVNVSRTVRWHDTVTLLYELGCRLYLECPPGQVLTALVRSSFGQVRAVALEDASLASAVTLLRPAS
jgi:malonate decarboxylase epsilon subunit